MKLNDEEQKLLERWLEDPSFHNWALQRDDDDIAKWEHYLNLHPQYWNLAKAGEVQAIGIPFKGISTDESQKLAALSTLLKELESPARADKLRPNTKIIRFWEPWHWRVAAAAVILMFIAGTAYFQIFSNSEVLLATGYGQQLESQLPDGSLVILNANSKLRYQTDNPREVWLEGEAFFEITKKSETHENFQVFTPDLNVTVLGTAFNINTRNDQTKVFLKEGKVDLDVGNLTTGVIKMLPGDLITYSKKKNELRDIRTNASVLENVSWKDGTLIFKDTAIPKALYEIEDIYGIQFVLQSEKIREEVISGGVPIKNLNVTLEILREVYGFKIRAKGKRYFITGLQDTKSKRQ